MAIRGDHPNEEQIQVRITPTDTYNVTGARLLSQMSSMLELDLAYVCV